MKKVLENVYNNGRSTSTVYEDIKTGKLKIHTEHDMNALYRFNQESQKEIAGESGHFKSNHLDGDRVIATIPLLTQKTHPEIWEDDQALKEFLDKHPQFKRIDVGWTRTTNGKHAARGGAKEIILAK